MSCLVSDVRKVHDISCALDLTDTVFVLFVFGEKLLLNHSSVVCCIEFIQSRGFQIVLKVSHLPSTSSRANVHFSDNFSASGLYNSIQHTMEVVYPQIITLLTIMSSPFILQLINVNLYEKNLVLLNTVCVEYK